MAGLPTSGLDPGALASAAIGQNQQMNQFNIDKTGLLTNALQSQANAQSALGGSLMGAANIYGNMVGTKTPNTPNPFNTGNNITLNSPNLLYNLGSSNTSTVPTNIPTFVNPFGGK